MATQPETKVKFSIFNEEFNEGIKEISDESKKLRKEFKLQSEQMKNSASETDKLKNRINYLGNEQDNVRQKIKLTEQQLEKAKQVYGENSKEANTLSNRLLDLQISEQKLENAIDHSKSALEQQNREMVEAQRENKKYKRSLDEVADGLQNVGQTLTASVTAPIIAAGTLAVETTREFREDLARLETNAKQAGVGIDTTRKAMRDLNAITGETDSNVEALSNLMATGMNDTQLLQTIEDLSGAVVKFPDTLKIEGLADGLQETLATGKAVGTFAELLERMGVNLEDFDEGLAKSAKNGKELDYALKQLNRLDLSNVTKEYREANKEIVEGREAQYDFMESLSELGRKLEPIMTKATVMVTDIVDAFNELDEETQDNIIKWAGFAAVLGPVTMGLGGVTKGISSVAKIGGSLSGLLGKVGGKALLGRITGLGVAGPAGLAIAGLTAMGMATKYLTDDTKNLYDATFEKVRQMDEEIQKTDELIARFEELKNQNMLTTDEMLEYMDILDELSNTSSPNKVKELKDRQAELLDKSTLTNDEMNEFLGLNEDIIAQAPNAAKAISDQGNAYADNLQALKDLNAEKREEMMMEAEQQLMEGLRDELELLAQQVDLQKQKNDAFNNHQDAHNDYISKLTKVNELTGQRSDLEAELKLLSDQGYANESKEVQEIAKQIALLDDKQVQAEQEKEDAKEILDTAKETLNTKEEELGKVNEELQRLDDLKYEYEALHIAHLGINAEKGQGLQAIDEELAKLDQQQLDLDALHAKGVLVTDDYNNQKEAIERQRDRLNDAKSELEQINRLAAETAYEKNISINIQPDLKTIEKELTTPLRRQLYMDIHGVNAIALPGYAKGTDFHPGGPAILGEEGPELVRQGNNLSLASLGIYDLQRGADVFTAEQTKRILSSLPAYASGVGASTNIVSDRLNAMSTNLANQQSIKNNMAISIEASDVIIDGHVAGRVLWKPVKENIDRDERRNSDFRR